MPDASEPTAPAAPARPPRKRGGENLPIVAFVVSMLATVGFVAVYVTSADTQLLGATTRPLGSDAIATTYLVLAIGGEDVAGILEMTDEWEGIPPHWMAYFEVPDCDAAAAAAREAGGTVSVEPFDLPYGRIAVLTDPFGAVFSVNQTPDG